MVHITATTVSLRLLRGAATKADHEAIPYLFVKSKQAQSIVVKSKQAHQVGSLALELMSGKTKEKSALIVDLLKS